MHHYQKIHDSFKRLALKQPSAPALITDDFLLTYGELDAAAEKVGMELRRLGIKAQEAVGVLTERSAGLPAAFMGILKAGGVYVPMVTDLPAERLANIARQADIRLLIVLDGIEPPPELIEQVTGNGSVTLSQTLIRPELLPEDWQETSPVCPQTSEMSDLAAILFTSGSTGIPKGVMIQHQGCVNMALGHIAAHNISCEDRLLLSASPGFILGFRELCLPFMSGASFVPVSRSTIDNPTLLLEFMERHLVSIAMFTPSYLHLLNRTVPKGLRCIITAGERPNDDEARHYARYLDYWNIHGATEVCGTICMHHVNPEEKGLIPSGRPFANTSVHLLDAEGNEVPKGEVGELHVIGIGVSPGYLKQPQLTAEYFVETPYGRAFRSHDLARWNSNGELETLGREDNVIKISGQSVSSSEIELALQSHPAVGQAKVLQLNGRLVACVECKNPDQREAVDWREFLQRKLPSWMIPAEIAVLAKIPINSAGKIDQNALLKSVESLFKEDRQRDGGTAPQSELEVTIAGIWEDLLDIRPIQRENNFFAVGGTSLLAIAVSQRLQRLGYSVPVQTVLTTLTVKALASHIEAMQHQAPDITNETSLENIATTDQEDFWIASEIGLAPAASHIVRVLQVRGRIPSPAAWKSAWTGLLDRHAALRTALYLDEKRTLCWRTVASHELPSSALIRIDHCLSMEDARNIVERWANERFQLTVPPLARAGLITIDEENETLFWFVLHHCVADGSSARLIQEDLLALLALRPLPPVPNGIALASFAEQQYFASAKATRDREFWLSRLDDLALSESDAFNECVTELPRPAVPGGRGAEPLAEQLDTITLTALGRIAKMHAIGLHALLLTILAIEIRRRSGHRDIMVGSGITIRPAGDDSTVGHFVNVLPVILPQEKELTFPDLLRSTQNALTETVEHGSYPAGLLYREFRQRHPDCRAGSRTSLFDIALTAIPPRISIDQEAALTLAPYSLPGELEHTAAGLDLSFSHELSPENGGVLNLLLTWNPDVCTKECARAWLSSFAAWARWFAEDPDRVFCPVPALLPHEITLLELWEQGAKQPRPDQCCHKLFEALSEKHPNKEAVVCRDRITTCAQLDTLANGIAQGLSERGAVRGSTVAVLTAGSPDLPATILGIWKTGATYLPLAYELPGARLARMTSDAGASILIVLDGLTIPPALEESVQTIIHTGEFTPSLRRLNTQASPDDIAYIIYTSGTTGTPKGVPVTHAAYINTILGVTERIGLRPDDRIALVSTASFDASLWELGHGLLSGIALVPVSQSLRDDPWLLKPYYRELGVTIAFHAPSYLRVSEQLPFEGLRILLTGGEAPNYNDLRHYADRCAFWNFYGPTEATIVVSGEHILSDHDPDMPLSVGRPLPNVRISIRREDGSLVPPGAKGELWLGGIGIAHGYINQPKLSAMHFVATPETLFYRTGDFGHWNTEGQIVISGRIDQQIKLNGQRVELGEIEQILCRHPEVANAVVLVEESEINVKVLKAFVQPNNQAALSEVSLTAFLAEHLSAHMIPSTIIPVAVIPLTPAGKIDRQALLNHARQQHRSVVQEMPQDPLEKRIAAIWSDLLKLPVARNDNFFALGGNSLLAVSVAHRVKESLGLQVSARALFAAPSLAGFVEIIARQSALQEHNEKLPETDLATEGEKEFWIAESAGLDTRTFTIPVNQIVTGNLSPERLQSAWSTLVNRHDGLRTFFESDETGQLKRRVTSKIDVILEFSVTSSASDALTLIRQRQLAPLSMKVAPLWRAGIVEARDENSQFFWLALHHAVGDGQSVGTLLDELTVVLDEGKLSSASPGAKVFAAREELYFASSDSIDDSQYWSDLLKKVPSKAFEEWPLDMMRSSRTPSGNHRLEVLIDPQRAEALRTLARTCESTLHSLIVTLLAMESARRSSRSDIMIGTTASVRESTSDSHIIGYGVNMLPLHLRPDLQECFRNLLRSTQQTLAEALQHARLPFSRIYSAFWKEYPDRRHPQRYPLFDIAVTENPGSRTGSLPRRFTVARAAKLPGTISYERTDASPGQDMVLIHENLEEGGLLLQLHVNAAIYTEESARILMESLRGWANWLAENPKHATQPLPPLLPEEEILLAIREQGESIERPRLRFDELFEMMVQQPGQDGRPAIITLEKSISYRALDEKANAIAHSLVQQGVKRGSIVGVLTARSLNIPATLLGIWKAGATYLPLASDQPSERLSFMAHDAGISHLIALDGITMPDLLAEGLPEPLRPEELSESFCQRHSKKPLSFSQYDDAAYIIYTSGSTGKPKGTIIGHDSFVNMVLGAAGMFRLKAIDRCLMFASPSFDVSLSDIGLPLVCGAAICPVPYNIIESPNRFIEFLDRLHISVADITPTYLGLFEGAALPSSLRILVTGGEAPLAADVKKYGSTLSYFNAYGPTENTITSTMGRITGDEGLYISAGRPLPNTSVHICNDKGDAVAPGVAAEIWLGGAGICQGYLNQPELTEASFIVTPSGRRYRTGDLGRWHQDGTIEIIGRKDNQVKLNGIRIEPGEIEYALASHPAFSQAVVVLLEQDEGIKSLWAFVLMSIGHQMPEMDEWKAFLGERLPSHMIPSGVIALQSIPLTAAGKVDRTALHALLREQTLPSGSTSPRDELECCVAEIWASVLGRNHIHLEDNFFALGGHSLLAIAVVHQLEKSLGFEVPARELFAEPTLAGFTERVRLARPSRPAPDISTDLATPGQCEFWTAQQAGLDTSGFNIPLKLVVHGNAIAIERWETIWNELISRHEALRTAFLENEAGILRRVVTEKIDKTLELHVAASSNEAYLHIGNRQTEPFSMAMPPLWRAGLTEVTESHQTIFWFVMHHAIGDGLSLGILIDELSALMKGERLPPPPAGFDRAAANEAAYLESQTASSDADYWQKVIENLIERAPDSLDEWPLDIPRTNARSATSCPGSHCLQTRIDAVTANALRKLARRNNSTLHALMLAVLGHEVRRRTGRSEFLMGTASSTRQSAAEAQIIGYFINMLPLACHIPQSGSFDELVQAMQQHLAEALQHSRFPFVRIYGNFREKHRLATHPARYPLFDIAVTENPAFRVTPERDPCFSATTVHEAGVTSYELRRNAPAQDLVLVHESESDGSLVLTWYANAAIYLKESALTWFDSLVGWMRFLGENSYKNDMQLPKLLPEERELLDKWQNGPIRSLPATSFPELFQQIVSAYPERAAIVTDDGVVSFEEINSRADALARALINLGVRRGETVGVFTEQSAALPETVLAIWKAAACYLPLTADLPAERLAFMARDAGLRLIIVLDSLSLPPELKSDHFTSLRPEEIAAGAVDPPALDITITPDETAYIIYTSGSTGVPKGVALRHKGMLNLAMDESRIFGISKDDRTMQIASPSFDLWISDLVITWARGACLVPVRRQQMNDISGIQALIERLGVTIATMSPSYLRLFGRADFPGLKILMTVGESPIADDARHYASKLAYFNGYGPTENSAATTLGRIFPDTELITAGRPLSNMSVYIMDECLNPLPPGVIGELLLGGIGLAAGYLNRPDLTAAAFVDSGGERLYRTGDLGRWLRTGELQILGRRDTQVKLRGQRVELGEIEHRLATFPGVVQAVALIETLEDQTQALRSFVKLDAVHATPTQAEWSAFLRESLPSYMIPSSFFSVSEIPLTAAGKVDRRALLDMMNRAADCGIKEIPEARNNRVRTPPQSGIEKRISEIWSAQLNGADAAREDNFFELGGDSLRAIAVINRLRREFECQVNNLYEHPVLSDFALLCRPRPDHLRLMIKSAQKEYDDGRSLQAVRASERDNALRPQRTLYETRIQADLQRDIESRNSYRHVLLTGATGYLGSYLLRELLADRSIKVTTLVRSNDNQTARSRLGEVLRGYFGSEHGSALGDNPRLHVLAGDLRDETLLLPRHDYDQLAASVDAIFHCAANVNHIGLYRDFFADNVAATRHLLNLAAQKKPVTADFHFVSTLSVFASASSSDFRLFTEYDYAPETADDNYYIRTKQEAERLVISSREVLANTCIHRAGNIAFATDSTQLQRNISDNAFFRQLSAFLRLGCLPTELSASLCHVDIVAKAIIALAGRKTLSNEIHHIDTSRRESLADIILSAGELDGKVRTCNFSSFLERLLGAIDEPEMESALAETVENYGLQTGHSPFSRQHGMEVASDRTRLLLEKSGITWPSIPAKGVKALLRRAMTTFNA
ncbi:MAG: amino acid adenylation domain-containing protein [Chlorobium sp.]|nr:MAG: amino acid adenylation domain-containing protein [Chlorobium sp.]